MCGLSQSGSESWGGRRSSIPREQLMIDVVSDHDGLFCLWARLDEQTEEIGSKDLGIGVVLRTR